MFPIDPAGTSAPESSTMRTSKPGMGLPAEPGFVGRGVISSLADEEEGGGALKSWPAAECRARPEMGEPDSEDHQLSMTWAPGAQCCFRRSAYMRMMEGSLRSPARKRARRFLRPSFLPASTKNLLCGSSRRMARRAVGGGEEDVDAVLSEEAPERAGIGGADRFPFEEDGCGTGEEGSVEDVGVANDPADVGGAEHDFAGVDAEEVAHGEIEADGVAASFAENAFGEARGPGGVDYVDAVVGGYGDAGGFETAVAGGFDATLPVALAFVFGDGVPAELGALPDDDF